MSSDAWDDDDQDQYRPRPKVDIGQNVRTLKPVATAAGSRRKAWFLILAPLVVLVVGAADIAFNSPVDAWHHGMPPVPAFIFLGGFFAAFLIALPGLMKIGKEQGTSELRIGDLGMEMVQTIVPGQPPMQVWAVLWKDLASAKLRYRDLSDPEYGLVVTSRSGETQVLRPADWASVEGRGALPMSTGSAVLSVVKPNRRERLEKSELVQLLQQKNVKLDDDVPRPQDRLAAIIGLSLGIGAILAALIFNYIETR